ncbi:EamA family transporter RarD [Ursidibacter sp. B-7004-1]
MLKGITFALSGNILFGLGYYFAILLRPLSDMAMFGFRIVVLIPFILLAIFLFKQQHLFYELLQKIRRNPPLLLVVCLLALNTGVQLWLFLWAPNNGQALQVSIGYLLLPLVTVVLGKIVFKEQFTRLKWASFLFALVGVVANIGFSAEISWATFVAGFGYPLYIMLRRYFQINSLATFLVELLLCLPVAIYYISQIDMDSILSQNSSLYYYLALLGLVNGAAFILFLGSSNLLPMNVLGLIGYAEPLIMLLISLAIGEVLSSQSYFLMLCLICSIFCLTFDSFRKIPK